MNKARFWQIVFYVSWTIIAVWLVLKVTGVINTPVWLEYGVPVAGLLAGVLGLYHNLIESVKQLAVSLAHVEKDIEFLKKDGEILKTDIAILKRKVR